MSRPDTFTTTPEDAARVESHRHAREPRLVDVYAEDLPPRNDEPHPWHEPGTCRWVCDPIRAARDAS